MKILLVEIYSPKLELLRKVPFNENGLSIIYGDVEKPKSDNETSNSIGKTVLLKILNVILGTKNSGKDTIKGLNDYIIKAIIKYNEIEYNIEITIGNSKLYYVNDEKMNLAKYKEKFNISRSLISKQINLDKRKGLLSSISKNANKNDVSVILKLLYLDNIELVFNKIKKMQEEIDLMNKYSTNFKEDINLLEKEEFNLEMKKKQVDEELFALNNRIETLKISEDIGNISQRRVELDEKIKNKNEILKLNEIRISKYEQIIIDSKNTEISLDEVEKIYDRAKIEIPKMIKKSLSEVEIFYDNLLKDKNVIYTGQIAELKKKNEKITIELTNEGKQLDELSEIIAESDSFKEAIKIYDNKTKEKIVIDTKISEINGKLHQINNSKELKGKVDISYVELDEEFIIVQEKINSYKEFIYNLVKNIYGEERNPYLAINTSDSSYKYKAMPVKIDLSIDGDSGEGISAAKYLLFDFLIMNYNNQIDFLIEDSACFEGIDRRQIKNILNVGINISEDKNKQFIVSLNKYLINNYDELEKYIVVPLSENDTLLNQKF